MKHVLLGILLFAGLACTSAQACRKQIVEKIVSGKLTCKIYHDASGNPLKTVWYVGKMPVSGLPEKALKLKDKKIMVHGNLVTRTCFSCAPHVTDIAHLNKVLGIKDWQRIR